jgi:hypothetical protein
MKTVGIYAHQRFPDGLRCSRCDYLFHREGELYYEHPIGTSNHGIPIVELVCEACIGP